MLLGLLGNAYCKKGFHVFDTILWQRGGFLSADVVFHFCRITIHFHIANMGFLYFLMLKKQRTFHLSRYLYTVKEIVLLHIYNIHTWGHYVISHLNYNPILPIIILTKQIRKIILPVWWHWLQVWLKWFQFKGYSRLSKKKKCKQYFSNIIKKNNCANYSYFSISYVTGVMTFINITAPVQNNRDVNIKERRKGGWKKKMFSLALGLSWPHIFHSILEKKYFALNSKGYCTLLLTRPMASPTGRKYGNSYRWVILNSRKLLI